MTTGIPYLLLYTLKMTEEKDIYEIVKEDFLQIKKTRTKDDDWTYNYLETMETSKKNKIIAKYGMGEFLINIPKIANYFGFRSFEDFVIDMDGDGRGVFNLILGHIISTEIIKEE